MRALSQWVLPCVLSLLLAPVCTAESIDAADVEFLEFLAMSMPSPEQETRDKLNRFASKLGIRADQQAAWDQFANHVIDAQSLKAQRRLTRQQEMQARTQPITAVEIAETHIAHLQAQLADAQANHQVLSELSAHLDDEQRAQFDEAMRMLVAKKLQGLRSKGH